eukprot:TRINITY_DN3910_c0_g1_i2.p1 TRINITY_DN3910_c0_g1~~TRINITY_DN3910_c0_g1_i2.p1  ORF type:complete len:1477 (+),score=578.58 TRINITY_DN3910_c0_g1_i2:294-4433(+)
MLSEGDEREIRDGDLIEITSGRYLYRFVEKRADDIESNNTQSISSNGVEKKERLKSEPEMRESNSVSPFDASKPTNRAKDKTEEKTEQKEEESSRSQFTTDTQMDPLQESQRNERNEASGIQFSQMSPPSFIPNRKKANVEDEKREDEIMHAETQAADNSFESESIEEVSKSEAETEDQSTHKSNENIEKMEETSDLDRSSKRKREDGKEEEVEIDLTEGKKQKKESSSDDEVEIDLNEKHDDLEDEELVQIDPSELELEEIELEKCRREQELKDEEYARLLQEEFDKELRQVNPVAEKVEQSEKGEESEVDDLELARRIYEEELKEERERKRKQEEEDARLALQLSQEGFAEIPNLPNQNNLQRTQSAQVSNPVKKSQPILASRSNSLPPSSQIKHENNANMQPIKSENSNYPHNSSIVSFKDLSNSNNNSNNGNGVFDSKYSMEPPSLISNSQIKALNSNAPVVPFSRPVSNSVPAGNSNIFIKQENGTSAAAPAVAPVAVKRESNPPAAAPQSNPQLGPVVTWNAKYTKIQSGGPVPIPLETAKIVVGTNELTPFNLNQVLGFMTGVIKVPSLSLSSTGSILYALTPGSMRVEGDKAIETTYIIDLNYISKKWTKLLRTREVPLDLANTVSIPSPVPGWNRCKDCGGFGVGLIKFFGICNFCASVRHGLFPPSQFSKPASFALNKNVRGSSHNNNNNNIRPSVPLVPNANLAPSNRFVNGIFSGMDSYVAPPPSGIMREKDLKKIMENQMDELPEIEPSENLTVKLHSYQKQALWWMCEKEKKKPKGGILADDMGVGKTVETIALMTTKPFGGPQKTLIVCPVSLVYHWNSELKHKTKDTFKSILIYHGSNKVRDPKQLEKFDVVITTFATLGAEWTGKDDPKDKREGGPLLKANWNRVILDEAHNIKNRSTVSAKACFDLKAIHRWCLTGTPIQNSMDDMFSLIHFLRFKPYCDVSVWKSVCKNINKDSGHEDFKRVRTLLKTCLLRRMKTTEINGKPILELPPKHEALRHDVFSPEEMDFYKALETSAQVQFDKYLKAGTAVKNYSNILVLLLRLRQACNHPTLVISKVETVENPDKMVLKIPELPSDVNTIKKNDPNRIPTSIKERLKVSQEVECPICLELRQNSSVSICGHVFCRDCIRQTILSHPNCPICRTALSVSDLFSLESVIGIQKNEGEERTEALEAKFEGKNGEKEDFDSTKIRVLLQGLHDVSRESPESKVVIFSQWTSMLDLIQPRITAAGWKYVRFDGTLSLSQRNDVLEKFRSDDSVKIILMSLKAGGVGINLSTANYLFFLDCWWNPQIEQQAIDRIHRIGQERAVKIVRMTIKDTVEERILKLQESKLRMAEGAIGTKNGRAESSKLSLEDLKYLFGVR